MGQVFGPISMKTVLKNRLLEHGLYIKERLNVKN